MAIPIFFTSHISPRTFRTPEVQKSLFEKSFAFIDPNKLCKLPLLKCTDLRRFCKK